MKTITVVCIVCLFTSTPKALAQQASESAPENKVELKTYLIEREIPDAGNLTNIQLTDISQQSCNVIKEMGHGIKWIHSYVTEDKVYCLYQAKDKETLKEHAKKGGFPVNSINGTIY